MTVIQIKRRRDITDVSILALQRWAKRFQMRFKVYAELVNGDMRIFLDAWPCDT